MASSSSSSKYPYPSDVYVADFVPIKLSSTNIFIWRSMMFTLIESHGLVGFLNGDTPAPSPDAVDYRDWKKTDELLRRWITSTLPEDEHAFAVSAETAQILWNKFDKLSKTMPDVRLPELNRVAGKCLSQYLPLIKAARDGDWEEASRFFEQEPEAVREAITGNSETVLMIAARSTRRIHFLKKLLDMLSPEDLILGDFSGINAFHVAAIAGNVEAIKLLTEKNPQLPYTMSSSNHLALHSAAGYGHRELLLYLLTFFQDNNVPQPNPFADEIGDRLLVALIGGGLFDVALSLVKRNPKLALSQNSPLSSLAMNHYAFPSGSRFNFWQRFIYSLRPELHSIFWKVAEMLVPQIKQIREKRMMHLQAHELLKEVCMEIVKLDPKTASSMLSGAFLWAVANGVHEVVEEILDSFPSMVSLVTMQRQYMFGTAIVYRHENVFNLVYQLESVNKYFMSLKDLSLNNCLHLAGYLGIVQKVSLRAKAPGAALQMQRELQWFKEVEKYMSPEDKEARNASNKTPGMVFTETHEELVKEGEQWMKETSMSCTIPAALIATIVFAAAITVPGGNNFQTSLPFFSTKEAFTVFAVSDALALFSSTSSLIMFLSVLTSRFAEIDFLYALPKRMIIGLGSLFLSIIFMMIAFAATLEIVFGKENSWILIPVVAFACIPITLFMSFQFPLLFDMIKSTYGPGIFCKQGDRYLF